MFRLTFQGELSRLQWSRDIRYMYAYHLSAGPLGTLECRADGMVVASPLFHIHTSTFLRLLILQQMEGKHFTQITSSPMHFRWLLYSLKRSPTTVYKKIDKSTESPVFFLLPPHITLEKINSKEMKVSLFGTMFPRVLKDLPLISSKYTVWQSREQQIVMGSWCFPLG